MKKFYGMLIFLAMGTATCAQGITLPDLYSMLDLPLDKIDTLMKQKKYNLLQREADSNSIQLYYNNLERNAEGPDWVRSVTCMEITLKNIRSRLVTYRTYRKKEYEELLAWLLRNGFKTSRRDEYKDGTVHVTYAEGGRSVLVKTTRQRMNSGVHVLSYEFEIGK